MRKNGYLTLQQMIQSEYGPRAGFLSSVLGAIGIFLNIVAQLLSAMALLSAVVACPPFVTALLSAGLMICYVFFGGMRGAGTIGLIKTVMLYICAIICVGLVFRESGGLYALYAKRCRPGSISTCLPAVLEQMAAQRCRLCWGAFYTDVCAKRAVRQKRPHRGSRCIGQCGAHPAYRAWWCADWHVHENRVPFNGRSADFSGVYPALLPGFWAGVFLAVLLVAIIGCGAGLTLGISSIVTNNLYARIVPDSTDRQRLWADRVAIIAALLLAVLFTIGDLQSVILQWSFMSMGLRGAVIFLPLCGALFLPGRIKARYAELSIVAGPLCVLLGEVVCRVPFDPLFIGMAVNLCIMLAGWAEGKRGLRT